MQVDVFPTVAAIGGLPPPDNVDGVDVSSLLAPSVLLAASASAAPDLSAAYHQYPACGCSSATPATCYNQTRAGCNGTPKNKLGYMGYTVRTAEWRYTVWYPWQNKTLTPDWAAEYAEELYNHVGDDSFEMDKYENVNEAKANPAVADKLRAQIKGFFSHDQAQPLRQQPEGPQVPDNSDPYDLLE